jgi:hypothetical protein
MREDPDGASLLRAASTLLRTDILPQLPAGQRHGALMIANAMSIAMRQLQQGSAPEHAELQALRAMLGRGSGDGDDDHLLRHRLVALNRELATRIRNGETDPGAPLRGPALALLRQASRQRVIESNPKVLKACA